MKYILILISLAFLITSVSATPTCYTSNQYSHGWIYATVTSCAEYNYNPYGGIESVHLTCISDNNADITSDLRLYINSDSQQCTKEGCPGTQAETDYYVDITKDMPENYYTSCWYFGNRSGTYQNDWVWVWQGLRFSNLSKSYKECNDGQESCNGKDYLLCENGLYVNKGKVKEKCGVQCLSGEEMCGTNDLPTISGTSLWSCDTESGNYLMVLRGKVTGKCGVECVDISECANKPKPVDDPVFHAFTITNPTDSYYKCENNICTPFDKITVMRFENNTCSPVTIYPKDALENDYDTLDICDSKIVIPGEHYNYAWVYAVSGIALGLFVIWGIKKFNG